MFNVVTIAREYGSGAGEIGHRAAEMLGWECIDRKLLERVASMGHIDRSWAEQADEQSCAWWERVLRGFRFGGPEGFVGTFSEPGVDRDSLQRFTARVIAEAGKTGRCVIVGRCAQCVLRDQPGVLHVLVWAPLEERLARLKRDHPSEDAVALLRRMDAEHARYAHEYFNCDFCDRKLFHICLNSTLGVETCARLIADAVLASQNDLMPDNASAK